MAIAHGGDIITTQSFDIGGGDLFVKSEATFGVPATPVGADSVRYNSFNPVKTQDLIENPEAGQGRTRQKPRLGRASTRWQLQTSLRPSTKAASPVEIDPLLELAFGIKNAQSEVIYTLAASQEKSATLLYDAPLLQEVWYGCMIENMTLGFSGQGLTTVDFTGRGRNVSRFTPFVSPAVVSDMKLPPPTGIDARDVMGVGNLITVGSTDVMVESVDSDEATVSANLTAGSNVEVTSNAPDPVFADAGDIHYGTEGRVQLKLGMADAATVRFLTGSISLDTGVQFIDNEFGELVPRAVVSPGQRQVNVNLTMNIQVDDLRRMGTIERGASFGVDLLFGDPDGRQLLIEMPQVTFAEPSPQRQEGSFSTLTLQGQATSTTANGELKLTTK